MPLADSKTITARLKKGEIDNIYYLYGQNTAEVEKLTAKITARAVGGNEDFALTKLNGKKLDFSEFYDIVQMMPMMSEYNCILVNDYNCEKPFEEMHGQTADSFNKKLIEILKEVPKQTVVIFNVTGFEVKTKKGKISDKNKKLADFIAKNGTVCEIGLPTPSEMTKIIIAETERQGCTISQENARMLAEMCLFDTLVVGNETDKLCAYVNGGEITKEVIEKLVSRRSSVTVFNLADAVSAFNREQAFDALDELMNDKNNRGSVLANITNSFLDLYRASCARDSGRTFSDVAHDYSYVWDFKVKNAFRNSSRMTTSRIRSCIKILRDTAVTLNSTSIDEKTVLEQALTKMLMTK